MQSKTVSSLIWKLFESIGIQVISFIVQIFLARILIPSEFGTMALVSSLLLVTQVIIQVGFSTWLIQAKQVDNIDYSSNFYFTLVLSITIYIVIFFFSPLLSNFYDNYLLVSLIRYQSLGLVISSFYIVRYAKLQRELKFKEIFYIQITSTIIQGISSILLALNGFGIWSLIYSNILFYLSLAFLSKIFTRDLVFKYFSFRKLLDQVGFSSRILMSGLLDSFFNLYFTTILFQQFKADILGYYNRGSILPVLIVGNLYNSVNTVMFSVISKEYNKKQEIKELTRKSFIITLFLILPAMFGIIILSKHIILLLYGAKWIDSSLFLQVVSLTSLATAFSSFSNSLNAMGRSDITFRVNLISKISSTLILMLLYPFGIKATLIATIIYSIVYCVLLSLIAQKYILYKVSEQLKDISPIILNTLLMALIVYIFIFNFGSNTFTIVPSILIGVVSYIVGSIFFRITIFNVIKDFIAQYFYKLKAK